MRKMKSVTYIFIFMFLLTFNAQAEDNLTLSEKERENHFALGQMMAECAATFRFFSSFSAARQQNPSGVEHLNNKANGWEFVATLLILNGSKGDAVYHVKETVQNLVDVKVTEYLARTETSGINAIKEIQAEFDKNCRPLVPLQEKMIQSVRQGS